MRCIPIAVMQHALVQQVLPLIMPVDGSVPGRPHRLSSGRETEAQRGERGASSPRRRTRGAHMPRRGGRASPPATGLVGLRVPCGDRAALRMPRHHVANCLGTKLPREIRMSGPLDQRPSRSNVAPHAPAQLDGTVHLTQHGLQSGCFTKRDDALIDEGALLHATLDVRDDQTAHRMGLPMSSCRQKLWHTVCNGEGPGRLASR